MKFVVRNARLGLRKVREAIINFVAQEEELIDDQLRAADWAILKAVRDFLRPFKDATLATEGKNSTIADVLISMDFLIEHYEETIAHFTNQNEFLCSALDAGYQKLLDYYNKKDRAPAYIAAVVLNPEYKWRFFEQQWQADDKEAGEKALTILWQEDYRGNTGLPLSDPPPPPPPPQSTNQFRRWISQKKAQYDDTKDELQEFLEQDIVELDQITALEWWCQPAQRTRFPLFSRMAIDILSIPAMLSESERVFLSAKRTIADSRWKLKATTIEALECSKSWLQDGVVSDEEL